MIPLFAGAFVAGLLGSPHCVGMCGAFATAAATRGGERRIRPGALEGVFAWQFGRLVTYGALGALLGGLGATLPIPGPVTAGLAGLFLAWFALKLAGLAPDLPFRMPYPTRLASTLLARPGWMSGVAFGALSALLPCGLLWSALAVAAAAGSAPMGGLAMVSFWAGTAPLLLAAARGLQRLARTRPAVRYLIAGAVFASGAWSIGTRGAIPAASTDAPECHSPTD